MIRKSTWVVVFIFAVLLAAVLLWQRSQDQKAAQATPTAVEAVERMYLFDIGGEVASLRVEHVGEKSIELQRDASGQWSLAGSTDSAIDSAAMDGIVGQLAALPLVSTLQNIPALQDLGLEPPSYRILVILQDGSQEVASVGKATPTGSGYYVLTSDRGVYIANEFSLQSILDLVDNPPYQATPYLLPADLTPSALDAAPEVTRAP
jgi:hypothetical protein